MTIRIKSKYVFMFQLCRKLLKNNFYRNIIICVLDSNEKIII